MPLPEGYVLESVHPGSAAFALKKNTSGYYVWGALTQGNGGVGESYFSNTDYPNDMLGNITLSDSSMLCNTEKGLVVIRDGRPYYVGANDVAQASKYLYQLFTLVSGYRLLERTTLAPVPLPAEVYLTRVSCSDLFTLAVDQDGNVWGAGSNSYRTLNDAASSGTITTLTKRDFSASIFPIRPYIVDVAASSTYALFLTNNGSVM
jgi:hypothetical protein